MTNLFEFAKESITCVKQSLYLTPAPDLPKPRAAGSKAAPAEIEDVVAGCVAASGNVGRAAALLAGLPVTTSGVTVNRACSSGLNAIANAARYVKDDHAQI